MFITRYKSVGVRLAFVIILMVEAFVVLPVRAASSIAFGWAKKMGGSSYDRGESLAVDLNGNVYSTGNFSATVDFNPGAGTYNLTSAGQADAFVSKLDANGNFVWAKRIGGTSDNFGVSIVPDGDGTLYFAGSFTGTVDFDPNAGTHNLTSAGSYDISVSKMDADGNFLWAFRLGGISNDRIEGLVTDGIGAIYITGMFSDTVDFDPGAGVSNLTSTGAEDIFIAKFDSSGNLIWAKSMPGAETLLGGNRGNELAVDLSGNIYTIGTFTDTVDFNPGAGVYNLSTGSSTNIFISKLNSNGNFVWAKSMGGNDGDMGSDIGIDTLGNVLSTGSFNGTGDFDPGPATYNLTSAGYWDNYISKLDANGNFVWAKAMGGTATDNSYGVALDPSGNVYTTGGFAMTVDFDPGPGAYNLTSVGSVDIFISKLDTNGNFVWVKHMPGTGIQYAMGIVVDETGNIYTVGDNLGVTDFDPGSGTFNLSTSGYNDIFVSKLTATPQVYYVKWNAAGANNGTSWTNAYTDLQSALTVASSGDEIWVAAGIYKPTTGTDRTLSFNLRDNVSVYGGFAGTETLRTQRNPTTNVTILSGDIGAAGNKDDNSYHVVYSFGVGNTTAFDGFTITAGNANGSSQYYFGGGMYNWASNQSLTNLIFENNSGIGGGGMFILESSPSLTNVTFRDNSASLGGGIHTQESIYFLTNVTFTGNSAVEGGAIHNHHGQPNMTNVTFTGNSASFGGGIYSKFYSNMTLTDVTFNNNSALQDGGGMHNSFDSHPALNNVTFTGNSANRGGGIYNDHNESVLTDVTFTNNSAVSGGAIYNYNYSDPILTEVTFTANSATDGGAIYNDTSGSHLTDVIFSGNSATNGGGVYNRTNARIPILENVIFLNNTAANSGGGIYNDNNNPTLTGVVFDGNVASLGGGMYNENNSEASLLDVSFIENQANQHGGGMYNLESHPSLVNVTFDSNVANASAGGLANFSSHPTLINVTFHQNTAGSYGGGIAQSFSHPTLVNVTFSGNSATNAGGGISNDASSPVIINSILYNDSGGEIHNFSGSSSPDVTYSIVQGGYAGTGNLNANPLLGPLQDNGGFTQTMALGTGSPAINAGDDTNCPPIDQRGIARPQGSHCDIGAYEVEVAITVRIGNTDMNPFLLNPGQSKRVSYASINNGPVKITNVLAESLIASERVIYKVNGVNTSFSEMMALPANQVDNTYWLPWYNNKDLNTQLRFANVSDTDATVHISIGGTDMGTFILAPGKSTRKSFPGIDKGPVKIESNVDIVAAERVIYNVNGVDTSFSEMMALPASQLDTIYWLPWYNSKDLDTQLRIANVSDAEATVHVSIAGMPVTGSPFIVPAGKSIRKSFPGIDKGPVKIESNVEIVAAERVIYKVNNAPTSFSETMALPTSQVDTTYWLPWYNSKDLSTQLRIANVSGSTATVHVRIGGVEVTGSPFTIPVGGSKRLSFPNIDKGPVQIESDVDIVAAERVIYTVNGVPTSFSEMMGLPNGSLDTTYWLPWYNNVELDTQLRFGIP